MMNGIGVYFIGSPTEKAFIHRNRLFTIHFSGSNDETGLPGNIHVCDYVGLYALGGGGAL
jgi:hypothetical protein